MVYCFGNIVNTPKEDAMQGPIDCLNEAIIKAHLDTPDAHPLCLQSAVDSTNVLMRSYTDRPSGFVIAAEEQSAGIGTRGRSFYSPAGTGLYVSILCKLSQAELQGKLLTPLSAVAVCRAIEKTVGIQPAVKWVNDVYVGGKKVCGILAQHVSSDTEEQVVILGIGINVYEPEGGFPTELAETAGALASVSQSGLRSRLLAELLNQWDRWLSADSKAVAEAYRAYSFLVGRRVRFAIESRDAVATVTGIDDACRLLVRMEDGTQRVLCAGDVSVIPCEKG